MAFRIRAQETQFTPSKATAPVKRKDYLSWLHDLPCIIDHTFPVEAAHLSHAKPNYGHFGRGKSRKASDRWALPLSPDRHRAQSGMNELEFWRNLGVNPYHVALVLFGLWSDKGEDATGEAMRLILSREIFNLEWRT